ncbi:hypothetical protein C8F01DRAFT_1251095 [Mycena amicta]|nr:hypothetical protein C8F01DRAFT_1251095 [Mycena amicta]
MAEPWAELEPPVRPFGSHGGTRSRSRTSSSSLPSLGGDSTRRKTFGMPSLLGRRAKAAPFNLDSRVLKQKLLATDSEPCASENQDPGLRPKAKAPLRQITDPTPMSPKSLTRNPIFQKLTTKFTRSAPPPSANTNRERSLVVPQADNAARQARNAALRERGLLPALPLSVQEARQDSRIATLASPEPESTLVCRATEASRIKDEWEAKNRFAMDERKAKVELEETVKTRLTEFRFGGITPASSPMQESFPTTLDSVTIDEAQPKLPKAPPPTLNFSRGRNLSPPLLQAWSDLPPEPSELPLPPSPSPVLESPFSSLISAFATSPIADVGFTPISPAFLPLPPSPSYPTSYAGNGDGPSASPRELSPASARTQLDLDISASESGEPSLAVPSLVLDSASESATTLDSIVESSNMEMGRMRSVKVRNSTIEVEPEPGSHRAIEVIVESPVEEQGDPFEGIVRSASPKADADKHEHLQEITTPTAEKTQPALVLPRRDTAPVESPGERRKSLLTSFRRSVGFGRAKRKSAAGPPSAFDVSLLPPSPTLPAEFASQQHHKGHERRTSVNPTMHSTGSIMFQTSKIQDEESRRMTEVAFM